MQARLQRALRRDDTKRAAEIEAELAMPPFPNALAYVWRAYFRLRKRAAMGFNGPNPIGWQDIEAFTRQTGFRLAPWEIALIEEIDDHYLMASLRKPGTTPPQGEGIVASASFKDGESVKAIMSTIGPRKRFTRFKDGRLVAHG